MIRYPLDLAQLENDIAAIDPRWRSKTRRRTNKFVRSGRYEEKSSLWSVVKPAYMETQHHKCVFCERQFENGQYGKIEFDLEHFRPKGSVNAWPDDNRHPNLSYPFPTGENSVTGYYWLAYEPTNYAASCKVCNSALKSNYFPIAGDRATALAVAPELGNEQPYLCYPLGSDDADPEDLITFVATTATPKATDAHMRRRGQIIIDFFDLNGRELLHRQRAQMISLVGGALAQTHAGTAGNADRRILSRITRPDMPHAACIRAHKALWQNDPVQASRIYEHCREFAFEQTRSAPPEI